MATTLVGTTAVLVINVTQPATFGIHADSDNSDTVNISTTDPLVATPEEELVPTQTVTYNNWTGSIWAISESGTQNVGITGFRYTDANPAVIIKT